MFFILVLAFVFIVFFVFIWVVDRFMENKTDYSLQRWPFERTHSLLSRTEKRLYYILQKALDGDYNLLIKVRMIDLFDLPVKMAGREALRKKIKPFHVDFVICTKTNIRPLAAVELEPRDRHDPVRRRRDKLVAAVFHDAGLPLYRIRPAYEYDREKIVKHLRNILKDLK